MSSQTVKTVVEKPYLKDLFKNASILPIKAADKYEPQAGRAYKRRDIIRAWKTVCNWLTVDLNHGVFSLGIYVDYKQTKYS